MKKIRKFLRNSTMCVMFVALPTVPMIDGIIETVAAIGDWVIGLFEDKPEKVKMWWEYGPEYDSRTVKRDWWDVL